MNIWTYINLVASVLISISVTGFILLLQHEDSPVKQMNLFMRSWIKVSLVAVSAGGFFNVLTLSTPPWSEVILNTGLGLLFAWAFYWHRLRWIQNTTA